MQTIREMGRIIRRNCTHVFIGNTYRSNQLLEVLKTCKPNTQLCIAADITGTDGYPCTRTVARPEEAVRIYAKGLHDIFVLC